jgi:sugar/nucleoside kinase (ribokinase family)
MSLISVGTMAFDAIETPFGKVDQIIGGSATYVAYAASNFVTPIQQVSIVGNDFPRTELDELEKRGVQLEGIQVVPDKKSFFWSGRYHLDMNTRDTLVTDLNVLADFNPIIPDSYQGAEFLMLGNLSPAIQLSVINQMKVRPKLIAMDTMNFWMDIALDELKSVLEKIDVLMINDSEARQLSGQFSLVKAAKAILQMGPKFLVIKKVNMAPCCSMKARCFSRRHYLWRRYLTQQERAIPSQEVLSATSPKQETPVSRT